MTHLTIREASRLIGRTSATIRRYIRSGRLKAEKDVGKFGEEYRIRRDDLLALGFTPAEPETASPAPLVRSTPALSALPQDYVPLSLYNELLMKHEQMLVQYGMIRAGGQKLLEYKADAEAKSEALERAEERFQALRQRAIQEIGFLRKQLREMEIKLEERRIEVTILQETVGHMEGAGPQDARPAGVALGEELREIRQKQQTVAEMLSEEARPIATNGPDLAWSSAFPPLDRRDDH